MTKATKTNTPCKTAPVRTPDEQALVRKHGGRSSLPKFKKSGEQKENVQDIMPDFGDDQPLWHARLNEAFGTTDHDLSRVLTAQLGTVLPNASNVGERLLNAAIAAISSIGPRDAVEAMLAAQMAGTHSAAMEMLRRLSSGQPNVEAYNCVSNMANKLLRTFAAQVEALNRHRNAGKQNITVTHIGAINAENAAIAVGCGPAGPGGILKNEGQSDEATRLTYQPETDLRSQGQAIRPSMPARTDAERAVLPARRAKSRRADG